MSKRKIRMMLGMAMLAFAVSAMSQTDQMSGYVKVDPNFKPARTPDGQPQINGDWQRTFGQLDPNSPAGQQGHTVKRENKVVDPPDGKVPYRPGMSALRSQLGKYIDPHATCVPNGVPRQTTAVSAVTVVQVPGDILMITRNGLNFRHIILDGRANIGKDMKLWMGNSRGTWSGNTLTVDVTNMNDKTWAPNNGIHSDQMTVIEKFGLVAKDTMQYEFTLTDPVVFERPWKMAFPFNHKAKETNLNAGNCSEGNKSVEGQVWAGKRLFPGFSGMPRPDSAPAK